MKDIHRSLFVKKKKTRKITNFMFKKNSSQWSPSIEKKNLGLWNKQKKEYILKYLPGIIPEKTKRERFESFIWKKISYKKNIHGKK